MLRAVLIVGLLVPVAGGCSGSRAPEVQVVGEWGAAFDGRGLDGVIAVREVGSHVTQVSALARAGERFLPASTFKVVNSLFALEAGVLGSVDELVEWDGVDRGIESWNRDHSLRTGIEVSAVWLYQHVARTIGAMRMAELVTSIDYGNGNIAGAIDSFWLDGELAISALEQLDVLERLATDRLPFSVEHQAAVRDILVRERGDGWLWRHKTGTALRVDRPIGWLVGMTEYDGRRHVFALNLDLTGVTTADQIDPQLRQRIAAEILVADGALPAAALAD